MKYEPYVPPGTIATMDPWVVIEEQRDRYVRYLQLTTGERWEVYGRCAWTDSDRDGPCMEGQAGSPIGPPEGRLDCPVGPGLDCSLCVDGGHIWFSVLPLSDEPSKYQHEWNEAENLRLAAAS